MAILEPVPAQADQVGDITITINSKGEINVDQSALATILGSGQQSARVTFVRVGEEGNTIENQVDLDASELLAAVGGQVEGGLGQEDGGLVGSGPSPILMLDQDQMMKLESVLQSDEAKNILGDTSGDDGGSSGGEKGGGKVGGQSGPTRRSQRQVDRETRQTADKIRAENQEIMRKEEPVKVEESAAAGIVVPKGKGRGRGGMMRGGARPRRQTRVPKHLEDQELSSPARKESQSGSESDSSESGSWASEDDPDRLWCVCQQPHNNRFMICCDICLDWFHGKCVGITKGQGKVMEEAGQDWKCPQCLAGLAENTATNVKETEQPVEMEEEVEDKEEPNDNFEDDDDFKDEFLSPPSIGTITPKKTVQVTAQSQPRTRGRRKSSSGGQQEAEKVKEKVVTCHMCSNKPRDTSIYCSEECIKAHANQVMYWIQYCTTVLYKYITIHSVQLYQLQATVSIVKANLTDTQF